MPKRILLLAFAVTAIALASCNSGYNPNYLYGTPTPSVTVVPTTPNPTASNAAVTVYVSNSPLPNQAVNLYSDSNGHVGSLITTQTTDSTGTTTFTSLTPAANYCFTTSYTPATPGATAQNATQCTDLWSFGITFDF